MEWIKSRVVRRMENKRQGKAISPWEKEKEIYLGVRSAEKGCCEY
jgi:hypothetical protein